MGIKIPYSKDEINKAAKKIISVQKCPKMDILDLLLGEEAK